MREAYQPGNSPPQSRNNGDLQSAPKTLQRKSGICHVISNDKLPIRVLPPSLSGPSGYCHGYHRSHTPLAALRRRETTNTPTLIFLTKCQVGNLTFITEGKQVQSARVLITTVGRFTALRRGCSEGRAAMPIRGKAKAQEDTALRETAQHSFQCCWTSLCITGTSASFLHLCRSYLGQQTISHA